MTIKLEKKHLIVISDRLYHYLKVTRLENETIEKTLERKMTPIIDSFYLFNSGELEK